MKLGLEGKIAIVTGSGEIIGKQLAITLAEEGARVVINDIAAEKVERTVAELIAKGFKPVGVTADVTSYKQVESMVNRVIKELGGIDILVNNVGVPWGAFGPKGRGWFYEQDPTEWKEILDHNIVCTMNCSRAVLPHMIERRYGKIINMSSVGTIASVVKTCVYQSGKGAVNQFTSSLAGEVGRFGINVNAIITGYTAGPRDALVEARRESHPEEYRLRMAHKDRMMAVTPLGRMATGDDYANAVAFLASDKSSYITGHLMCVTGGFPQILAYSSGAIPAQGGNN